MNQHSIALPAAAEPLRDGAMSLAHDTLIAGCRFLIGRAAADPQPDETPTQAHIRLRVAGNHLKELDRFLGLLIGADAGHDGAIASPTQGIPDAPPRHRRANPALRLLGAHWPRLRAIKRLRLAACTGHAGQFGSGFIRDLAVAAPGLGTLRQTQGTPPAICETTLADIARFYLAIAQDLAALPATSAQDLDFCGTLPHMG